MKSKNNQQDRPVSADSFLKIVWRCFGYLKPYWYYTAGAYLVMLGISAINMVNPRLIQQAIDRGVAGRQPAFLTYMVLGLLGLVLLKGVLTFFQGRWTEVASQSVAYELRNAIQKKLTILSFSYHDQSQSGELLSRTIQDVDRIRFLTGRATLRILDSIVMLTATTIILITMNPRLALLALLTMPLVSYWTYRFSSRFRPISLQIQKQLAVLTTRVEQNLRGARVVKAFAQEDAEIEKFARENTAWFNLTAQSARLQSLNLPFITLIANISTVMIIWYGGSLVIQGQITVGYLVAFMTYLSQLIQPVRMLGNVLTAIVIAAAASERVFEVLDAVPEVKEKPHAIDLPPIKGNIQFDHVYFSYGTRISVLNDIHFSVQPNQIIALLGPTGCGKSTVTNLLCRFYDPTQGRILIDGIDIREVTLNSLRSQIGMVLQDTILFATTIRQNIAFGRPQASQEEIIQAAKAAQAHDFIMQTPQGYDSYVGEQGITLSGGQKQRVAIARAILTNPRILILDDATSSVDTETELLIQKALENVMIGRTTFVIAHRLSTLRRADLILVMDRGRIVSRGTHQELLFTSKFYQDIYEKQLKPLEPLPAGGKR